MQILEIYNHYDIPPNLVRHQLEVAAVGNYLLDHWLGTAVDQELVIQTLLLHDMGNIIKFKRPFLGELEAEAGYWEKIQDQYFKKYGTDVHLATLAIVNELGLPSVAKLIDDMKNVWSEPVKPSSLEARICEFADCCVTPQGITSFEDRLSDLKLRYHYTEESEAMVAARQNAEILRSLVSVNLALIQEIDLSVKVNNLRNFVVSGAGFDPATATL